jgi:hypothetical protein
MHDATWVKDWRLFSYGGTLAQFVIWGTETETWGASERLWSAAEPARPPWVVYLPLRATPAQHDAARLHMEGLAYSISEMPLEERLKR